MALPHVGPLPSALPSHAVRRVTYRTVDWSRRRAIAPVDDHGHGGPIGRTTGGGNISRLRDVKTALAPVVTGCRLGVGGILLQRKPLGLLRELVAGGTRELRFHSFLASLDAELLAAHDALSEAHIGYVGFEQLGTAPAFEQAAERGEVDVREYTEYLFVNGLRAALAGLPFLPTKGGTGSQVLDDLGLATVTCPYTGVELVAAPALHLDVAVLHAEAADANGNVLGPIDRSFLFDFDANLARAADHVIVSVERVVDEDEVRRANQRTLLYGFEVDTIVHLPGGAAPTGLTAEQGADVAALQRYLASVEDGTPPREAFDTLLARDRS